MFLTIKIRIVFHYSTLHFLFFSYRKMLRYNLEVVRYNKNMLFNSYAFIFLFLPFTLIGFFMIGKKGHHRIAISWLVGASLFFYGWWNPAYLGLILFSILFNYSIGVMLVKKVWSHEKSLLFIGISGNIVLLGYFKYANFFVDNIIFFKVKL